MLFRSLGDVLDVGYLTAGVSINVSSIGIGSNVTMNTSTVSVGANVTMNTSTVFVGNSSVNTAITAGTITLSGVAIGGGDSDQIVLGTQIFS